jgi:Homing endonuclease associated repeat
VSKEEIMAAIRECARRLGRAPSFTELKRAVKVTQRDIRKQFCTYTRAVRECGLERQGSGHPVALEALFTDWAAIVRKLGKLPTVAEYQMHSRYSIQPLCTRFGSWRQAPLGLLVFAQEQGLEAAWGDVIKKVRERAQKERVGTMGVGRERVAGPLPDVAAKPKILPDRPTYGPSLMPAPLAHGPINEAGVIYLFGMLAGRLGFVVTRIQTEFPDCEAMRQVDRELWQRVRIEFEFESRNFLKHLHRADDCDLIVCWTHNWPECPLEVVELRDFAADFRR